MGSNFWDFCGALRIWGNFWLSGFWNGFIAVWILI